MVTTTTTGLIDHLGRPLTNTQNLRAEISGATLTGVRSVLSGHPEIGLDPVRLATLLRGAEHGDARAYLELAEAMEEKDTHYLSVLGTRKRAVAQLPITVEAADASAEAERDAELIRTWLKRDTLEDELFDILDAVGKGYSVSELVWETSTRLWMPRRIKYRLPTWFQYDKVDGETLRLRDDTPDGADLEPFKYIVHEHKAKSGLAIRGGLARVVAWSYLFKNFSLKDWVAFAEVYGLPFRLGRYDTGATADDRRQLLNALAQIGSDAAGIIPKSTDIEFVDGKMAASDGALFEKLATYLDQGISKAVLGQTATTDAVASGLGGGLGKVHDGVRGDIERADAKQLAATLNQQLIQPMVMLNHGPRLAYPRLVIGREESVDLTATVDAMDKLVRLGLRIPAGHARKLIRAPEPKGDEELLSAPEKTAQEAPAAPGGAPTGPADPKRAPAALLEPLKRGSDGEVTLHSADLPADPDAIDQFIGQQLDGWEPLMAPMVAPIAELLGEASDLEDARDRLLGAIETMDGASLAELLARAGFNARVAGAAGETLAEAD